MQDGGFAVKGAVPRRYCVGPVAVKDRAPLAKDIANFRAALDAAGIPQGFMTAASPGVITSFQLNQYYPSHEAYLEAIAEAMRFEYEAIVGAGFILQLDCPDLAMSRHTTFQDQTDDEFSSRRSDMSRRSTMRWRRSRRKPSACTSVGAITKVRTIATSRWTGSFRSS